MLQGENMKDVHALLFMWQITLHFHSILQKIWAACDKSQENVELRILIVNFGLSCGFVKWCRARWIDLK